MYPLTPSYASNKNNGPHPYTLPYTPPLHPLMHQIKQWTTPLHLVLYPTLTPSYASNKKMDPIYTLPYTLPYSPPLHPLLPLIKTMYPILTHSLIMHLINPTIP